MADILINWVFSAKGYDKLLLIPNMNVPPSRSPNTPPAPTRVCTIIWSPAKREEGILYPPMFQLFSTFRTALPTHRIPGNERRKMHRVWAVDPERLL